MPPLRNKKCVAIIACLVLAGVSCMTAAARSRTTAPIKFEIKVVDSVTGKPKSKYYLGETVKVVFTVKNQGRRARTIYKLPDTPISYTLVSMFENKDTETFSGWIGGTAGARVTSHGVAWTYRQPDEMTLAAGQSVSMRIDDLRTNHSGTLPPGNHTLTATYVNGQKSMVSFRVVIDEAKSITLLEKMAAEPNGDEGDKAWARIYLEEIRQPSLAGLVTDTAGRPLKDVKISVTGRETYSYETRSNGRYYVRQLTRGATYTLTPSLKRDGNFEANYTFEPQSRTITNLNSKLTGLNFKATRVRPTTNVADRVFEGASTRASSTLLSENDRFEPDNVIDGNRSGPWDQCCNAAWSDDTPNSYPDWVEITLKGPAAIDWINVFTLRDNPKASDEPTLTEIFTKDGITDFDVQYWTGRFWKNVPGGSIRGNRNVWRKIAFPTITTDKIRVVVRKALTPYSKIMEIEAFHINEVPDVKLTGRSKGQTGSKFQFHTNAADRDRGISEYTFSFGDGTPNYKLTHGDNPGIKELNLTHTHTYAKAGTYTVTVRVIDHDDEGSETEMTVTVTDPPKPPFAGGGTFHGVVGEAVVFEGREASDPVGRNVHYYWDFGDGKTGTGPTASHKYAAPGTYTVILLIVDDEGARPRYAAPVVITAAQPSQR